MFKRINLFFTLTIFIISYTCNTVCSVVHIKSQDQFKKDVMDPKKLKVVKFFAEWCGPCKNVKPKFEKVAADPKYSDVIFAAVDVDTQNAIAEKYKVRSMPTIKILDENGKEVDMMGNHSEFEKELMKKIDKHNGGAKGTIKEEKKEEKPAASKKEKPAEHKKDMKKDTKKKVSKKSY